MFSIVDTRAELWNSTKSLYGEFFARMPGKVKVKYVRWLDSLSTAIKIPIMKKTWEQQKKNQLSLV